jgi:hypothetical protein
MWRNRSLLLLLCDRETSRYQPNHCERDGNKRSLHGPVHSHHPRRANRLVAANSGDLNRRFAPADCSTDSSSRRYNFGSKFGTVTSCGGRTCNKWCSVPRVTSLAVLALRDEVPAIPARLQGAHWLVSRASREGNWFWKWKFRTTDRHVRFDPDKFGWPWFPDTVSWVVPTATCLLLRRLGTSPVPR